MNLLMALVAITLSSGAQHSTMPAGMSHEEHQKQMQKDAALKKRGADAMGFDQDTTVHHFRLSAKGGSIEVEVLRPADIATRDQIRTHLKQIARDFAEGDFGKPLATHAEVPPGTAEMRQRRAAMVYRYEETPRGGRVVIETSDGKAKAAVHTFLRYQTSEHKTR